MEESISGFKVRGDWGDVVEHGERVTQALRDAKISDRGVDDETDDLAAAFEEWDEWRPKAHETLATDVNEKTAEQAHIDEGGGEKAGKDADDDIQTAGEKLSASYEALEEDAPDEAVDSWKESIDYVARAADTASRKALRRVEDTVYKRVMTQLAPYYFDNELISANIQQAGRNGDERFVFEVNVNDDGLKGDVSKALAEYEDEIDRWHVAVEKDTDAAEAIEGAEAPPEPDPEEHSHSTTN